MKERLLDLFCGAGGASVGYSRAGFDVIGVDHEDQPHYPFPFIRMDSLEAMDRLMAGDTLRPNSGPGVRWMDLSAAHASPPCQAFCRLKSMPNVKAGHLNLIPQTRERLRAMGVPYVIENVPGAPLIAPVMLCGTMFGMKTSCGAQLRRHRLFETNWCLMCGLECRHKVHRCGATARDPYLEKHRDRTISVIGHQAINPWRERQIVELEDGRLHRTIVSEKYRERVVIVTGHTAQTNVVYNQVRETFPVSEARIAMGIDWMPMSRLSQAIPPAFTEFIGRQLMEVAR